MEGKDLSFCKKNENDLSKFVANKKEKLKNPYLFKIEQNELTTIKDYVYAKPPIKIGTGGGCYWKVSNSNLIPIYVWVKEYEIYNK